MDTVDCVTGVLLKMSQHSHTGKPALLQLGFNTKPWHIPALPLCFRKTSCTAAHKWFYMKGERNMSITHAAESTSKAEMRKLACDNEYEITREKQSKYMKFPWMGILVFGWERHLYLVAGEGSGVLDSLLVIELIQRMTVFIKGNNPWTSLDLASSDFRWI